MKYQQIVRRMRERTLERPLNRRTFLFGATAATTGLGTASTQGRGRSTTNATPAFSSEPFTLGVASGEPLPDGVVIWTRLAPIPFEPFGGMPLESVEVGWVVAEDERLSKVVRRGTAIAEPDWGHSVHVEVGGLQPDRWYWYQFTAGAEVSPLGRTKTAPPAGTMTDLRFAFASCQRWDHGLYTAFADMAQQDLDLVVHLGDYIYESTIRGNDAGREGPFPSIAFPEPRDLESYRFRYGLYKLDPDLQEAHRLFPWLVTWDDHEVYNNVHGALNRQEPSGLRQLERRAAAYQAYYEHQPLRRESIPVGPDLQLYRRRAFGDLLEFNVLDTRQYRDLQAMLCGEQGRRDNEGFCPDALDPARTMLGERQKAWLFDGLAKTTTRWSALAQQLPMARIDLDPLPGSTRYGADDLDTWDGYAVERDQVVAAMAGAAARGSNPVVLTGDTHSNAVWDLKTNWDDGTNRSTVATELVGTSISSGGDTPIEDDGGFTTECGNRNGNPHNLLYDNHRGYVMCSVTADRWQADYRILPTVKDPSASASTLATFVVEHARPGAHLASGCASAAPD